jgi:transcriptional regulator with XRE-family HTH domain
MAMVMPMGGAAGDGPGPVKDLIWALENKQERLGLSNEAMAGELGVTRNYWYRLRTGDRNPGWPLIGRILAKWPGEFEALLPDIARHRALGGRRGSGA